MIYLSGCVRKELEGRRPDVGFMMTPWMGNRPNLEAGPWGADNGCFTRPNDFDLDRYLAFLAERPAATALFATAPDVVGDARATMERSLPVLPMIRALGYPAALVAQDGLEALEIPWAEFDVLFIGGSTEWKLGAACEAIVREAKRLGKWVHMGRVNSYKRIRYAEDIGCDSADGTFVGFAPDQNVPRMLGWMDKLVTAPRMVMA